MPRNISPKVVLQTPATCCAFCCSLNTSCSVDRIQMLLRSAAPCNSASVISAILVADAVTSTPMLFNICSVFCASARMSSCMAASFMPLLTAIAACSALMFLFNNSARMFANSFSVSARPAKCSNQARALMSAACFSASAPYFTRSDKFIAAIAASLNAMPLSRKCCA